MNKINEATFFLFKSEKKTDEGGLEKQFFIVTVVLMEDITSGHAIEQGTWELLHISLVLMIRTNKTS